MKIQAQTQLNERDIWRAQMQKILLPNAKLEQKLSPAFDVQISQQGLDAMRADYLNGLKAKTEETMKDGAKAAEEAQKKRTQELFGNPEVEDTRSDAEKIASDISFFLDRKNVRYDEVTGKPYFQDIDITEFGDNLNHILKRYGKDSDFLFDLRDILEKVAPVGANPLLDYMRSMVQQVSLGKAIDVHAKDQKYLLDFREAVLKTYAPVQIPTRLKNVKAKNNTMKIGNNDFDSQRFTRDVDTMKTKQGLSIIQDTLGEEKTDDENTEGGTTKTSDEKTLGQIIGQDEVLTDKQKVKADMKANRRKLRAGLEKQPTDKKTETEAKNAVGNDKAQTSTQDKDKQLPEYAFEADTKLWSSKDARLLPHVHSYIVEWNKMAKDFIARWQNLTH